MTVQSARPSSRSSLRSSGSIGSFSGGGGVGGGGGNHRRPSSAPLHSGSSLGSKGVLVSTSRSGAARSAAILLISCHISAINKTNKSNQKHFNSEDNVSGNIFIDESMSKYLQKQLNQQKQMLHLELPSQSKKIIKLLELNGNLPRINQNYDDDDDDGDGSNCAGGDATGIYYNNDGIIEMGALPTPASETAKVVVKHFSKHKTKYYFLKKL